MKATTASALWLDPLLHSFNGGSFSFSRPFAIEFDGWYGMADYLRGFVPHSVMIAWYRTIVVQEW